MEKDALHENSTNGGFNPFSFSLMFGTLSEEKIEESQELVRDVAIAIGRHVSPLRGKRRVYCN